MKFRILQILADLNFEVGLIGISEYGERLAVAQWLMDESSIVADPRQPPLEERHESGEADANADSPDDNRRERDVGGPDQSRYAEFLFKSKWLFTRSDPDPYPSTPHGHLQSANRSWPKLNPYTGRAFKTMHQEEPRLRLGKHDMKELWCNESFRDFCRSYVLWYMEFDPAHKFSVTNPLRFPRRS